jgi:hypothetical protein
MEVNDALKPSELSNEGMARLAEMMERSESRCKLTEVVFGTTDNKAVSPNPDPQESV